MPPQPTELPAERSAARAGDDRRELAVARLLLVLTGVVFLVVSWGRMTAPFGDSDEGINAAVWAYNSRSLRELGPIESAMGGKLLNGTAYATHPPLIVVTTALAEIVGGERELVSRLPAWLGALATIPLLDLLLRRARFRPIVAALGASAACLTPMFTVYGPMLDTPVTSLPFGIAVLILWLRDRTADGPAVWAVTSLAALACLSGWQATLLVAACGITVAVRHRADPARALRRLAPWAAGGVVGLGLSLGWSAWAHGGFGALEDKFGRRAGSAAVSYLDVVTFQLPWLAQLLSVMAIGLIGCALAIRTPRLRPLAVMALTITLGYGLLFKEAAAGHQYWLYWSLVPVAIGMAWISDQLLTKVRSEAGSERAVLGVAAGAFVLLAVIGHLRTTTAESLIVDGWTAAELVQAHDPIDGPLHYVGETYRPDSYTIYYAGHTPVPLITVEQVRDLAAAEPDRAVLVLSTCGDPAEASPVCTALLEAMPPSDDRARSVPAAELRDALEAPAGR